MRNFRHHLKHFVFLLILFLFPLFISAQTPPDEFLGHKVGADRKLADWNQITGYFQKLDKESNRMKVLKIGESTVDNKPLIMAVITSEDNMDELDTYTGITQRLRNARGLTPEKARELSKQGKPIVLFTCNIHSTEIASSQMSMEFAYNLVTGKTPFDADKVLDDVIVLLVPSSNPDGEQMVTEWYRKWVGTKYEGGRMPWLYHHYAGHDNNRDWFMMNLKETRAVNRVLYHDWIPQIHIDEHQMGSTGARLFVPPFKNPPIPNVHPLMWRGVALCGMNMSYDLQKNGFTGVVHGRSYTGWWIGACDDTSWLHNTVGLLSEMASVDVASPIYIESTELPDAYYEKRMQFPDPWPGGWWRLRDLVDYELCLSMSLVKTAYLHKEDFLYNFYKMNRDNIQAGKKGEPYAFVIPKEQRDTPTTMKMLDILKIGGVEIHQAEEEFVAGGKVYPAGSYVVKMSQPYRPYAQALLEKQEYPDIRQYPGGPPEPPYDNAGWTLPLQMGVECERIEESFQADLTKVEEIPYPSVEIPAEAAPYLVLDSKENAAYSMAFALLEEGTEVYRSKESITEDEFQAAAGSFLVKNSGKVQQVLPQLLEKWHATVYKLEDAAGISKFPLDKPRVALYQSWRSNMDEGWTRYVFDHKGISYTTLHNKDFRDKKGNPADLSEKFDVIFFASESADIIKTGQPDPESRWARYFTEMPPKYKGGIEKEGVKALKNFVEDGGILVTLNDACELVFDEFDDVPARNATERYGRDEFFCPTSILRIKVENDAPLGYGFPEKAAAMFSRSFGIDTWIPSGNWDRNVVASYPKKDILLSGWLLGEEKISRKSAVVDLSYKKGHIVLIGFRCQHRAQSHGTYKFLFNSIFYPENN
ncbi:hypothetical protein KGY73_11310 [bacterium]|nr:hypothetical protein [bacterium]